MKRIILKKDHQLSSGRIIPKGDSHYVDRETAKKLVKAGIAKYPNAIHKLSNKKVAKEKGVYDYKSKSEDATDEKNLKNDK